RDDDQSVAFARERAAWELIGVVLEQLEPCVRVAGRLGGLQERELGREQIGRRLRWHWFASGLLRTRARDRLRSWPRLRSWLRLRSWMRERLDHGRLLSGVAVDHHGLALGWWSTFAGDPLQREHTRAQQQQPTRRQAQRRAHDLGRMAERARAAWPWPGLGAARSTLGRPAELPLEPGQQRGRLARRGTPSRSQAVHGQTHSLVVCAHATSSRSSRASAVLTCRRAARSRVDTVLGLTPSPSAISRAVMPSMSAST